jgi:hypothetical protein
MKTITVKNVNDKQVTFNCERFINWNKATFVNIYKGHFSEVSKVFDLICKINGEVNQPIAESPKVESKKIDAAGNKKSRTKKTDSRP